MQYIINRFDNAIVLPFAPNTAKIERLLQNTRSLVSVVSSLFVVERVLNKVANENPIYNSALDAMKYC